MASLEETLLGKSPEAVVSSQDVTSKKQQDALNQLLTELQGPAPQVSVPVTADQQQLIDTSVGGQTTAQGEVTESSDVLRGLLDPAGSFAAEVQDPLIRDFREKILPQIGRGFGSDFFSSERRLQDERATEDLVQSLASEKSRFLRDDRGVQLGAAGGLREGAGQRGDILSSFLESAGVGRDITETGKLRDEQLRQQLLQMLLGGSTAPTKETVGIGVGGSSGLLAPVLGGLAQGVGSTF